MKLCIDLCCGLGGFSQAFMEDADWEVIRIDISDKLNANIIADICDLPLKENLKPDVLLMSPPCERFSIANSRWPQHGIGEAMTLVGACLEAVIWLKPKYWCLENPKGRLRWFMPWQPASTINLGDYGCKIMKPSDLWGNIPLGLVPNVGTVKGIDAQRAITGKDPWMRSSPSRAEMPYKLSEAIKEAANR